MGRPTTMIARAGVGRRDEGDRARISRGLLLAFALLWGCAVGPEPSAGPSRREPSRPATGPVAGPGPADPLARQRTERDALLTPGALPRIPARVGPIQLRVRYPVRGQRIADADSNFIFGSVGTGDARLEIDGRPVLVEPNGAFLAWLPVPDREEGGTGRYRLVARRGTEVVRLEHPVRLSERPELPPPDGAWVDPAALADMPERWALPDEELELRVRATAGLAVWIEAGDERFPLAEREAEEVQGGGEVEGGSRVASYEASVRAGYLWEAACQVARYVREERPDCGLDMRGGAAAEPTDERGGTKEGMPLAIQIVGTDGFDTLRLERELPLGLLSPEALPVAELREAPDSINGSAGVVVGRPTRFGPYRWRFPEGTRVLVDGRIADRLRVRLAPELVAWVSFEDARLLADGPPPESPVGDLRVEPREDRITLRVGLRAALPIQVAEPDSHTLAITLFGALGETDRIAYGAEDPLLESVSWEQLPGKRYRLTVRLSAPIWGYRALYETGDAGAYEGPRGAAATRLGTAGADAVLRIDIRRPPVIDGTRPLRGIRVAVDPGHPGGGSTGPTGLFEGDANLAVARRLAELLREEGAEPVLVRADESAVGLYERTERAREAEADLFVSIHNNALPDGVRPFGREGTSSYYYHAHSRDLAASVQRGMLTEMGLRDLGILWGDLAVARISWMPAVLTEGAFMMIPRHEAALRTPRFQDRYARGILRGIEAFLRGRAR